MHTAMIEDAELLRRYAREKSQEAFAELVRRRIGLVYSVALRHTHDAHRAEDVTQAVFTDLARKAGQLVDRPVLVGWLFRSAQFAASDAVRAEVRRQIREQEANTMERITQEAPEPDWAQLRPVLDEVLNQIDERDRDAILLRFFDGESFGEVGAKLRLSENAARMRVERALDKLRSLLARRGVTSTTAALAVALANQPIAAAPAGLAAAVTGAALAGGTVAGVAAAGGAWTTFMSMTKLQMIAAGALTVAAGTGLVLQANENAQLGQDVAALQQQNQELATVRAKNRELKRNTGALADYRNDDAALGQLRDESAALRERLSAVNRAEQQRAANAAAALDRSKLDRTPVVRMQPRPQYPVELRRAGIAGEVIVEFIVDNTGRVQNVREKQVSFAGDRTRRPEEAVNAVPVGATTLGVGSGGGQNPVPDSVQLVPFTVSAQSLGGIVGTRLPEAAAAEILARSAVAAVEQWQFDPGRKSGRDVNTRMRASIVFTLTDASGNGSK
jgi:RNA polymerase sigma factor (sigma-70 family)